MKSIKKLFTRSITAALVTACVSLAGLTGCSPAGSSGGLPGDSNSSDNNITINRVWTSNSGGSKKIEVTDNTVNVSFCDQRTDYKDVLFTAEIIEKNDSKIYLKINNITDPNSKSSWNINQYTVIEYSSLTKDSVIMKLAIGSYANIETIKNTNPLYWSTATYTKK